MHTTVFERHPADPALVSRALADSRLGSFWLRDAPGERYPSLTADTTADLVVVGGGYTGLWTALEAKRRNPGTRVVILEARTVGWAASGRNGGFVEASLTHGEENGRTRFASEYDELVRLGRVNLDGIQSTVENLSLDCDWERTGEIDLATEEHQVEWLREGADGKHSLFLDRDAVRAQVHSPTYLAGLFHPDDVAIVHPAKLAAELARACTDAGVEIFENTPVTALDTSGLSATEGVDVRTARGTVRATQVAAATNVFPSLLKRNRLYIVPVYDYVLMTEPLTTAQLAAIGWEGRQGLGDSANQFHYYRLSADNRILFGGYDAIYHYGGKVREEYEDRPETFQRLASHFFTTFPQLEDVRFTDRWAGAIDTCSRFCAFFGSARDNRIAYAAGYTGLGVAATRFGAEVMLDLLAGEKTERTETEMVRSKPLPFPPEPAASIGVAMMRSAMDKSDHNSGKRGPFLRLMDAVGLGFDS